MRRLLKWLGVVVAVLVGLVAVAVLFVAIASERRIDKTYDIAVAPLILPTDAASLAEGQRLATIRGCTECHGADLGGQAFIDEPMLATVHAANLTGGEGSATADYAVEDWVRAIRHGIGADGRSLVIMPSYEFSGISDEQLGQLVAYLESVAPVNRDIPEPKFGLMGRTLFVAGQFPTLLPAEVVDHMAVAPASVPARASVEYGAYLAASCTGCHQANLGGGPIPGQPPDALPSADLTPSGHLSGWTLDGFVHTLRTGVTPEGKELDPAMMPWTLTREMTDVELEALWLYLSSLPPIASAQ